MRISTTPSSTVSSGVLPSSTSHAHRIFLKSPVGRFDFACLGHAAMREQLHRTRRCAPIVLVADSVPINAAIEDIILLDEYSVDADWVVGILYLPLQ